MNSKLRLWLHRKAETLSKATIKRVPTLLPDEQDIHEFINLLIQYVGEKRNDQLTAVQFWALTTIGHDAPAAFDWLTILRILKQEIAEHLLLDFSPGDALEGWVELDEFYTFAFTEASHLARDVDRVAALQQMEDLKQEIARFELGKTNFIAVSAHELRTPLTILEGYANMLRIETEVDSRLRIFVDGLENGIQRMKIIINDLIDISLIDLQSIDLNYQHVDLERILNLIGQNQKMKFEEREVELTITPFDGEHETFGDPEKLVKAFTKLFANALKYTPGGGQVSITGQSVRTPVATGSVVGYIGVQFMDTGIGIDPIHLETIFDRFTTTSDVTLHSSSQTSFKGGGPGLGLPIARGIMEAHGGRIWAESSGCDEKTCPGSTFFIELPILDKKPVR